MTQSGIQVSKELAELFSDAVSTGNYRLIRVSIDNESLVSSKTLDVNNSWNDDFVGVQESLEEKIPCYILYRLDTKSPSGDYEWIFLSYVPDDAKVRDKTLYASTRATLTKELGDYRFVDSMHGTAITEFSLEEYERHKRHKNADAPLTQREKELAEVKAAEASASSYSTSARKSHVAGIAFPLSDEAIAAVKSLNQSESDFNLVQLSLDVKNERIELDSTSKIDIDQLANTISSEAPRFSFFAYEHTHEGQDLRSTVFIYTCPTSSKIRERMLYSSCRGSVISYSESECGLTIAKKLETSDPNDLTKSYILEELHPPSEVAPKLTFSRPRPPGRRGGGPV
ncbi:actin depolymerizing protein [Gigaspora margarita]|uniref:Twinfilin n=1 Tax=Gigaspora margarita TaxID=4874 RepID=A0A8H4AKS7_GIGMA|nr:actin depolymerizing protein [Gigaspora margarita]